ncbi:hypothetical protein GW17_00037750 [Ensete ventricosum]|nr:hypothetical protein GW17_00037750 [Ensete ventricosum]RZR88814.1 hypothetical protein BHM03_00016432 [Ensete ventricosum]
MHSAVLLPSVTASHLLQPPLPQLPANSYHLHLQPRSCTVAAADVAATLFFLHRHYCLSIQIPQLPSSSNIVATWKLHHRSLDKLAASS